MLRVPLRDLAVMKIKIFFRCMIAGLIYGSVLWILFSPDVGCSESSETGSRPVCLSIFLKREVPVPKRKKFPTADLGGDQEQNINFGSGQVPLLGGSGSETLPKTEQHNSVQLNNAKQCSPSSGLKRLESKTASVNIVASMSPEARDGRSTGRV
jgi:hypothetical protein